jgi:hypothetical protein
LSSTILSDWDISRETQRRGLVELAKAGLISVEKRGLKHPQVTMLKLYGEE